MQRTIFRSDATSQIEPFSCECLSSHYKGQLKTVVEQKAGKKIDWY